jgi:bifunctional non-homologous end joining protein LigD
MLAQLTDAETFGSEEGWAFEMKWDGVRVLAYLDGGPGRAAQPAGPRRHRRLRRRRGRPRHRAARSAVLDGEVVVLEPGRAAELRPAAGADQPHQGRRHPAALAHPPARLMLFDVLELDGQSLLDLTYDERRAVLDGLVQPAPGSRLQVPPVFDGDLEAAMATSEDLGLEGVVASAAARATSPWPG